MPSSWCPWEHSQQLHWLTVTCLPRASAAQAPSWWGCITQGGRGHAVTCSRAKGWSLAGLGFEASPSDCPPQLHFPSRMAGHTYQLPPDLG